MSRINLTEIERRKPVWLAISEFYLHTELDIDDILRIKVIFRNSGYSLEELKDIDFYEVKPIVGINLWSVAGVWAGFDEVWLWNKIQKRLSKKRRKNGIITKWKRKRFETDRLSYWNEFENEFKELKEN